MRGRIGSARVARGLLLGGLALAAASGEALLAPAAAATKAGVSAAVHGTVERSKEAAPASPLKSGEDVFMGDTVRNIMTRLLGVVLAALAVQFVIDGVLAVMKGVGQAG